MATATADAQEVVLEAAALEVVLELLFDIRRQVRALRRQIRLERREVLLDKLIEERALRAAAFVDKRTNPRAGFPGQPATATRSHPCEVVRRLELPGSPIVGEILARHWLP